MNIPENTEQWSRTGSSYTCNPPVTTTDFDIVMYVTPANYEAYQQGLLEDGWEQGGSRAEIDEWTSFKKREDGILYNFIVTNNESRYDNMRLATEVAKRLSLLRKHDRVMLFHAIVDGIVPTNW